MKKYRIKYIPSAMKHWVMDYTIENRPVFVKDHLTSTEAEAHIKQLNLEQRELAR